MVGLKKDLYNKNKDTAEDTQESIPWFMLGEQGTKGEVRN